MKVYRILKISLNNLNKLKLRIKKSLKMMTNYQKNGIQIQKTSQKSLKINILIEKTNIIKKKPFFLKTNNI